MVCPPQTNTGLNLILMEAENVNMTDPMRMELKEKAYDLLQGFLFAKLEGIVNSLQEENRTLSWFNGNSQVSLPKKSDEDSKFWSYEMCIRA